MKNKASTFVKNVISVFTSLVKSKTVGIRNKTNAFKARLIMLSLMRNKKVLADSLSHKIHNLLGHHSQQDLDAEDLSKAVVLYNSSNGNYHESESFHANSMECEACCCNDQGEYDIDDKYPDLRHSLFDEEDMDLEDDQGGCGSVIDMVRNSKEEEGQNFSLEDEIDNVADLFIKKFYKQIRLQKLESFKRIQEMLARSG